jgi:hypothetical protein
MTRRSFLSKINNWVIYILLTATVAGVIIATTFLIDYLRKEEIKRIELFATAMKYQQEDEVIENPMMMDLLLQISKTNNTIPVIVTDKNKQPLDFKNIDKYLQKSPEKNASITGRNGKFL